MSERTDLCPGDGDEFDGEVTRGLTELERLLSAEAPTSTPAPGAPGEAAGETERVARLRTEVAEGARLRELYAAQLALDLDSPRVLARRRKGQEAAKLHALAQHPAVRALQAQRMLVALTTAGLVALVLALGWSTANVQTFAAAGAPPWSPGWLFAWLVEPFVSLALLTIVGAKAFLAVRGRVVTSPTLDRIEVGFLALTLAMQLFPVLPAPVGSAPRFVVPDVVLHCLGPVIAVAVVKALPVIWAEFTHLDHHADQSGGQGVAVGVTGTPYPPSYSDNSTVHSTDPAARITVLTGRARYLIDRGALPARPSANALRKALGCGMDQARAIRDRLDPEADRD